MQVTGIGNPREMNWTTPLSDLAKEKGLRNGVSRDERAGDEGVSTQFAPD